MIYAISIRNFVTFTNRLWVGFHFLSLVYRFDFQNFREFRRKLVWKLCEYGSPAGIWMLIKNRIYVWTVFSAPVLKENYHQQVPSAWNYLTEKRGRKTSKKRFDYFYTNKKRTCCDVPLPGSSRNPKQTRNRTRIRQQILNIRRTVTDQTRNVRCLFGIFSKNCVVPDSVVKSVFARGSCVFHTYTRRFQRER